MNKLWTSVLAIGVICIVSGSIIVLQVDDNKEIVEDNTPNIVVDNSSMNTDPNLPIVPKEQEKIIDIVDETSDDNSMAIIDKVQKTPQSQTPSQPKIEIVEQETIKEPTAKEPTVKEPTKPETVPEPVIIVSEPKNITVVIPAGSGSNAIANLLKSHGVIEDAAAFDEYTIQSGKSRVLQKGTFHFTEHMAYSEILKILTH
ncbi:hypothetical protein AN643_01105 [Candidatus Epulonipiscioides saccharophilum]|nr:hypothetical protein AN643_01105 [Epulopiscium sp. SCG-B10WGA-EpuloB]